MGKCLKPLNLVWTLFVWFGNEFDFFWCWENLTGVSDSFGTGWIWLVESGILFGVAVASSGSLDCLHTPWRDQTTVVHPNWIFGFVPSKQQIFFVCQTFWVDTSVLVRSSIILIRVAALSSSAIGPWDLRMGLALLYFMLWSWLQVIWWSPELQKGMCSIIDSFWLISLPYKLSPRCHLITSSKYFERIGKLLLENSLVRDDHQVEFLLPCMSWDYFVKTNWLGLVILVCVTTILTRVEKSRNFTVGLLSFHWYLSLCRQRFYKPWFIISGV